MEGYKYDQITRIWSRAILRFIMPFTALNYSRKYNDSSSIKPLLEVLGTSNVSVFIACYPTILKK